MADERELFEDAVTETAPANEPAVSETPPQRTEAAPAAEDAGTQPRAADGKFTAKEGTQAAAPTQQMTTGEQSPAVRPAAEDHRVPLTELLTTRERAQNAERERDEERRGREADRRQAAALQAQIDELKRPKGEPPDPYADPAAFRDAGVREAITPLERQMEQQRHDISKLIASDKFGSDVVDKAVQAMATVLNTDPGAKFEYQRIVSSTHPYGELVAWHKRQSTLAEIGSDPAAYRARVLEDAKKDPAFVAAIVEAARAQAGGTQPAANGNGQARPNTIVRLPPSLNGATGSSAAAAHAEMSEEELFQASTRR